MTSKRKSLGDVIFGLTHMNLEINEEIKPEGQLAFVTHKLLSYLETKEGSFKISKLPKSDVLISSKQVESQVMLSTMILSQMAKSSCIRKWAKEEIVDFPTLPIVLVFQSPPKDGFKPSPKPDGDFNLGKSHPCVCIGPWKFCFNTAALVIPKVQHGIKKAFFCLTVGSVKIDNAFVKKTSDLVVKWNSTQYYTATTNSWTFCKEFLELLGTPFNPSLYSDPIKKSIFIKMDKFGPDRTGKSYNLPNDVLKSEKSRKVHFDTHKEFDELCSKIYSDCKDFATLHPMDHLYLKGIDEAFHLKHFRAWDLMEDLDVHFSESKCPFGDPRERGCYLHTKKTLTEKKFSVNL
jgi:hypothetical protein